MTEDPVSISEARKRRRAKAATRDAIASAPVADPEGAEGAEARQAGRFRMTAEGLYRHLPGRFPEFLCAFFEVLGETYEAEPTAWGLLLAFRDRDMRPVEFVASRAAFTGDSVELTKALAQRGFNIRPGRVVATAFSEYLYTLQSPGRLHVVKSSGWHLFGAKRLFVLPTGVVGDPEQRVIHQARLSGPSPFGTAGTLDGWQRGVAARAVGNSRLALAISCAFAGPLLDLVGEDGGIVHLRGPAKSGKTTCLRAAASAWGFPGSGSRASFLRSWRATGAGLEGVADMHSDTFLPIDELGAADAREIGDAIYFLSSGQGRTRGSRAGGLRETTYFRIMALSSGEIALADKMQEAGKNTHAGQELRLLDLDALGDAEIGAFENLHGAPSLAAFAARVAGDGGANYGHAGPAMVTFLVRKLSEDPEYGHGLAREAAELATSWLRPVPDAGAQVANAARRFALIAVAGSVATDAGVTGWPAPEAAEAARKCFLAWLADRGFAGSREEEDAVRRLHDFCQSHGKARFEEWPEPRASQADAENPEDLRGERTPVFNRAGWRRFLINQDDTKSWRYFLTGAAMREALKGLDYSHSLRVLVKRGFIGADTNGRAGRTLRVPGHDSQRLYEVTPALLSAPLD